MTVIEHRIEILASIMAKFPFGKPEMRALCKKEWNMKPRQADILWELAKKKLVEKMYQDIAKPQKRIVNPVVDFTIPLEKPEIKRGALVFAEGTHFPVDHSQDNGLLVTGRSGDLVSLMWMSNKGKWKFGVLCVQDLTFIKNK